MGVIGTAFHLWEQGVPPVGTPAFHLWAQAVPPVGT